MFVWMPSVQNLVVEEAHHIDPKELVLALHSYLLPFVASVVEVVVEYFVTWK